MNEQYSYICSNHKCTNRMRLTEKAILNSLRNGDRGTFRLLFDSYFTQLFFYAQKFVDEETARDLVQDVFLTLWNNCKTLTIDSSLEGYLFRMVRNKCLQNLEKQKVRRDYASVQEVKLKMDEIHYFDEDSGITSLIEQELEDKYEEALSKLPEKCRLVFEMSRKEGKKNREIAEEMGISVKAVEKHISKALSILKDELKDYLPLLIYFLMGK
ncbi:RNA polymerase sigma-70 factor [Puteibacter caeruleilacunae]|nr:RNA polymerase sigma-70 factor [Puteibacter caeruleilacunae]